jgi:hypothetical protein
MNANTTDINENTSQMNVENIKTVLTSNANMNNMNNVNLYTNRTENVIEKLVNKPDVSQNKSKNLVQNIGTRVSKLREVNENFQKKIREQEAELKLLDEKISNKKYLLEYEMQGKGEGKKGIKLHDHNWVNMLYCEMLERGEINMRINSNHEQHDPELKKIHQQKESELSQLQNNLNNLIKKTEHIKNEINVLRVENHKHRSNLDQILDKKDKQSREMDKISEEANKYLQEKGTINKELVELNEKIDNQRTDHENKMQELNKMIDNTKKIKKFHETLALEKFSKNTFRKTNYSNLNLNTSRPTNKISEEKGKLSELQNELEKKKRLTVYFNFSRLILLKKQQELNNIIEKVKKETGIENLDKLSADLQLSTKTNKLFETDLKNLHEQKAQLEINIEDKKREIEDAKCLLNDTSTKKIEYLNKLSEDLKIEEKTKKNLNMRMYMLNRMIELISKGFKNICEKLNFFDKNLKFDAENDEDTLTKCMDFLERKMIEIIQLNTDPLKDTNMTDNDEVKNMAILEKVAGK